ncbi:MAG: energy transducer TonB [Bacteroidota bacterium]
MPRFPGCDHVGKEEEKKECSNRELNKFIYRNLEYPEEAKRLGLEGTTVISFIVNKDGSVSDVEIVTDPGAGMGEAAAVVVRSMPAKGIRWVNLSTRGRPVRVQMQIPVHFRLSDLEEDDSSGG